MALSDSLAQGLAAMQGRGVDPATLYGMAPAGAAPMPAPAAPAAPQPAPGVSPEAASAYGMVAPSFAGTEVGQGPQPGHMPGAYGGSVSTAPNAGGIGKNTFGLHPNLDIHAVVDYLLPRVRNVESGGDYKADRSLKHPGQTASGAYQHIDSTWGGYKGFKRAVDAPPEIQDERARQDFLKALTKFGGDPFKAVASHYYPRYANDPTQWTKPVLDGKGNPIPNSPTVEQYVSRILPKERLQAYLASQGGNGMDSTGRL